jgi:tetratricopeptide (TPR) repeat protein
MGERLADQAQAQLRIASELQQRGLLDEALRDYLRLIEAHPGFAEAHNNAAVVLHALGRHDEALAAQQKAAALLPHSFETQYNLGNSYIVLSRQREAVEPLERAIALRDGFAPAHNALAIALQRVDRFEEAETHFRRAIELQPDFGEAYCNLGIALRELGRLPEATSAFESAVAIAPERGNFHRYLAETKHAEADDPEHALMERLLVKSPPLPEPDRIELHFALGKVYDDLGIVDDAIAHLHRGNVLKRSALKYDEAATLGSLEQAIEMYGESDLRGSQELGFRSDVPVFIFGMPRSGTTLVEQILAAHPDVYPAGETDIFERLYRPREATGDARVWRELGKEYVALVQALAGDALRVTDKTLLNFRFAGAIHLALPTTRMIHVRRDAMDTCFSCYSQLFVDGLEFSFDLGELGRYYRAYSQLMRHWRTALPPEIMLEVDYEELVHDLERQARRILHHCGLTWNPACLDFMSASRPVRTASVVQVRRPVYRSSVSRWRAYARHLEPLARELRRS